MGQNLTGMDNRQSIIWMLKDYDNDVWQLRQMATNGWLNMIKQWGAGVCLGQQHHRELEWLLHAYPTYCAMPYAHLELETCFGCFSPFRLQRTCEHVGSETKDVLKFRLWLWPGCLRPRGVYSLALHQLWLSSSWDASRLKRFDCILAHIVLLESFLTEDSEEVVVWRSARCFRCFQFGKAQDLQGLVNGFGLGLNAVAVAQYVSEVAPANARGR